MLRKPRPLKISTKVGNKDKTLNKTLFRKSGFDTMKRTFMFCVLLIIQTQVVWLK